MAAGGEAAVEIKVAVVEAKTRVEAVGWLFLNNSHRVHHDGFGREFWSSLCAHAQRRDRIEGRGRGL